MEEIMQVVLKVGELAQNLGQLGKIFLIFTAAAGLLNCFFGYKLLRLWVTIVGLVVGGLGGAFVGYRFLGADLMIVAIIAGVAALALAAAAFYIYKAGIFLLCAAIGMAIFIYVIHPRSSLTFFLCLMAAVGVGALGVAFVKPIVIVTTSVQGGLSAGAALTPLLYLEQSGYGRFLGVGIAALGLLFQILTNLHKKKDDDEDEDDGGYDDRGDFVKQRRPAEENVSQKKRERRKKDVDDGIEQW